MCIVHGGSAYKHAQTGTLQTEGASQRAGSKYIAMISVAHMPLCMCGWGIRSGCGFALHLLSSEEVVVKADDVWMRELLHD